MDCICNNILYISIAISVFLFLRHNKDRFFAFVWNYMSSGFNSEVKYLKDKLFKSLNKIESHDPVLRKENSIKILEIGVGTGANFTFYPKGTRLMAVDPNPHFASHYNKNRMEFNHIQSKKFIVTRGDDMHMIKSNSIDVVVATVVLCSIDGDLSKTMNEIYRVLTPNGKYYFLEHTLDINKDNKIRIFFQHFLTRFGIWPFLFGGCSLIKEILPDIKKAGFKSIEKDYSYPTTAFLFEADKPFLYGVATK